MALLEGDVTRRVAEGAAIVTAPNTLKISEVFVFASVDGEGNEGVCAFQAGELMMPMVAADYARVDSLRDMAKLISGASKMKIRLLRFSRREEVEVVAP